MKNYTQLLILFMLTLSSCALFQPKDIGRNTVADLSTDIEKLISPDRINKIVQSAVEGALEGTSSEESAESIKELVQILTEEIKSQINPALDSLNTKAPAENLVNGAIDAISSEQNKAKIDSLLTSILRNTDKNLEVTLGQLEKNLNRTISGVVTNLENEVAGLDKTIAKIFSDVLQDSLSNFINGTIEGIDMAMISKRVSEELLTKQLRDTIGLIFKNASEEALGPAEVLLNAVKKNAIKVALVIAGIIFFFWWLRRRFVKMDKDAKEAHGNAAALAKAIRDISAEGDIELERKIKEKMVNNDAYDKYKET